MISASVPPIFSPRDALGTIGVPDQLFDILEFSSVREEFGGW